MGKWWYTDSNGKRKRTKAGIAHEYSEFQSSAKSISERSARNSARRSALKRGAVHKGDGKDVDHIHGVSAGNGSKNLRVLTTEGGERRVGSVAVRGVGNEKGL